MSANWPAWMDADDVDLDLGLIEVRDNPDEHWTMRALAGHSVGMPVEAGYRAALDLQRAVGLLANGVETGKKELTKILGADRIDYQRALFYALAGRGPIAMVTDLNRLVYLMRARQSVAGWAKAKGLITTRQNSPYCGYDGPEVSPGQYCANFDLKDAWDGLVGSSLS
jgi:hypothetical protein